MPFREASKLSMVIPVEENAKFDVYIDDLIGIMLDINDINLNLK